MHAAAEWPYIGWIPTVSGWLSFSHAGSVAVSHYVLEASAFNNTLQDKIGIKALVVHQQRNLSDRPFSTFPLISQIGNGRRGLWDFFACLRELDKNGKQVLCGRVWILSSAANDTAEQRKIAKKIASTQTLCEQEYISLETELDAACRGRLWYCISVEVFRDGTCRLSSVRRSDVENINDATSKGLRVASSRLCAFEVHSFIKDVFHRHKYHAPDDDTIAPMVEISDEGKASDTTSLQEWAKRTTHYLHSSVISFSRNSLKIEMLQDAKGILCYLDSFQKTHQPNGADPAFNITCLENSIKNSIDKEDFVRKDWRALFTFITVMLLAPFASVTGILKGIAGDPIPSMLVSAYGLTCATILLGGWYVYIKRAVPMGMGFSVLGRAHSFLLSLIIAYPRSRVLFAILSLSIFCILIYNIINLLI